MVSYRGRWYVTGHDTDRDEPRVFRLSRVQGEVRTDGKPGSYEVPAGHRPARRHQSLAPQPADRTAAVLVRSGAAHGLRRHAQPLEAARPTRPTGWDRLEATYGATDAFADEVLGYGADVVVESPAGRPRPRRTPAARGRRVGGGERS